MGLQKLSHIELRVKELDPEAEFHTSVLGLVELDRQDGQIFFGCGPGTSYDVALREGGTGIERFAVSVDDEEDLAHFEGVLGHHGVKGVRLSDPEPGVEKALEFQMPSGHLVRLVTLKERLHYSNPGLPSPQLKAIGSPLDLDHITLRCGDQVERTMQFMSEVLGFKASDTVELPTGEMLATFMRVGDYHHDLAMFKGAPNETLDHVAWTMSGIEHIKLGVDCLGRTGRLLEAGLGRHAIGGNLYAYFRTDGGNRYEFSAEMPRAADHRIPAVHWKDASKIFSAWGAQMPESFLGGS